MSLPITAILPTRNCRAELERHLQEMAGAWAEFSEVIAIDSESTDGTLELLQEFFAGFPKAKVVTHPPGLYQSWNHAVSLASQPWIYFSTVGDNLGQKMLSAFYQAAADLDCDVLISPPRMMKANGSTPADVQWPVHRILNKGGDTPARLLTRQETVLGLYSFITGTLLGSSASNLYRAEFLQSHPFPEEFGHAGDTAWGLRYGPELRMGVFPGEVATFTLSWEFREHDAREQRAAFLRLCEEGKKSLRRAMDRGEELEFLAGWFEALTATKDTLWCWLADQAELAADHHALVAEMQKMEKELARRWPERVFNALVRIFKRVTSRGNP